MARRVRDSNLESRSAREKLKASPRPYYKAIGRGLHTGYRKGKTVGRWVARIYLGKGSYSVETLGTADDVHEADGIEILDFWQAQEKARELQRGRETGRPTGPQTVKDAITSYIEHLDHQGKDTTDPQNRADVHILPSLGDIEVLKLTAARIRKWLKDLADQRPRVRGKKGAEEPRYRDVEDDEEMVRRRRASANRTLTVLKAALNHTWSEGKVASDREWRSVKPFAGVDVARIHYLTIAEAQRFLNTTSGDFGRLVRAALETGARYSELARVRVEDFNSDVGTLTIRKSKTNKTRHIVLTDDGIAFFKQASVGRRGRDLMLPHGDREWRKSEQARPMAEACARAKIEPPIGFHALRHTWASLSVMSGMPLMVVAKNLGHSDTRMVEKHYGHLAPSYVADAIRANAPRFGALPDEGIQLLELARP